jgi:TolB-like protein/Flp pilus assembly protein TadD
VEKPFPAYTGDGAYVFVSYSHDDDAVLDEIRWLQDHGINVWYDEGISPGSEWSDVLAKRIQDCSSFVYFLTPPSVASEHCRREISFAQTENRPILAVHLEQTEVPAGLRLSLDNRQAILAYERPDSYRDALLESLGTPSEPEEVSAPIRRGRRIWLSVLAAVLLIGFVFVFREVRYVDPPPVAAPVDTAQQDVTLSANEDSQPLLRCSGRSDAQQAVAIAILPLQVQTTNHEQQIRGQTIAYELWDRLAPINSLRLISMRSSSRFADSDTDIRDIAKELTASFVIDGFITSRDERTVVSVHIIDAESGTRVWNQRYDESLEDITDTFAFYDRLASEVTSELQEVLQETTEGYRPASRYQPNIAAYNLVQNAFLGVESLGEAIERLDRAIEIDPNYDQAYARKAQLLAAVAEIGAAPSREGYEAARRSALKALDLNPNNAEAHGVLGGVYDRIDLDFRKAFDSYARAEDLCAQPDQLVWKQDTLLNAGLYEEGVQFTTLWEETDPTSANARMFKSRFLRRLGDVSGAQAKVAEALDLAAPGDDLLFTNAFQFYYQTRDLERAALRNLVERWVENREADFVSAFAISYAWFELGEYEEHIKWFKVRVEERAIVGWIKDFLVFQYPDYFDRLNEWALSEPERTRERLALISEHRELVAKVTQRMVP